MPERELVQVVVRLEPETYESFKALVGARGMSPAIRRMVEEYAEQEAIRRRIDAIREQEAL